MRVTIEPAASQWRPAKRGGAARRELAAATGLTADSLVIATGHQAWHWHPGILSKYLAASSAARKLGGAVLDIVVDQDVYDPLRIELPVREGDAGERLTVQPFELAKHNPAAPPGMQPAADREAVLHEIDSAVARLGGRLPVDLSRLREAWSAAPQHGSLTEQVSRVLHRLMEPWTGEFASVTATRLLGLPSSRQVVGRMLLEAERCVRHYNAAAQSNRAAGISALLIERERIELPLWWLTPGEPRRRVFADVADTTPLLVDERGEVIELDEREQEGEATSGLRPCLAPRAMLLTALMRAFYCDFFIHGTGGGVYDRVTEAWWQAWRGETLAPLAVVTADVPMRFEELPLATPHDLERAVWYAHHLPHNLDRHLPPAALPAELIERKRRLLEARATDTNRKSRRRSFEEMHRIDAQLVRDNAGLIRLADEQIERARTGVENAKLAQKRDWCFALHDDHAIGALAKTIDGEFGLRLES